MVEFVAIDVETSNSFMGSICQIGMVHIKNGREIDRYSTLVNPEDYFDFYNVKVHGISEEMVASSPKLTDIYEVLLRFTKNKIITCHTHFDRTALRQALDKYGLPSLDCTWLDTARVARRAWPDMSGHGLASLAQHFNINFRHHDAVEDASVAAQILLRAIEESGLSDVEWLERVQQPVDQATALPIRHEGSGDGPLVGETIVFTGALMVERREAAKRAHSLGAVVRDSPTKKMTILVVGDQDLKKFNGHEKSRKHRVAEELIAKGTPIRIVAESDFFAFSND